MKFIFLFILFLLPLVAEDDYNTTIVQIKDTSGLTEDEVRKKVQEKEEKVKVEKGEIIKAIIDDISKGKVDISKFQKSWDELSPTPIKYDWVQTKSGEWFKGDIKSLYKDKLEFDSDEIGLYTFDFDDVKQIKSFHTMSVNIENAAIVSGIIRFKNDEITIIQGDKEFRFPRDAIISFAPSADREFSYWSGKVTFSMDIRKGNKEQYDYSAQARLKRRTSSSNLYLDYLGRISSVDGKQSANDHRFNEKYDRFISRKFFWTPLSFEYYQDKFQNIKNQITAGVGIGYMFVDSSKMKWDVSAGPAFTYIRYISAIDSSTKTTSAAFDLSTKFDFEITSKIDFKYSYKLTLTNKDAGRYKHHMVSTFENEITSWLDLDLSFIWDYLLEPQVDSEGGVPLKSDYQFLVGIGIEF